MQVRWSNSWVSQGGCVLVLLAFLQGRAFAGSTVVGIRLHSPRPANGTRAGQC